MHARPKTVRDDALGGVGGRADGGAPHHLGGRARCEGRLAGMLTIGDLMRAKVV